MQKSSVHRIRGHQVGVQAVKGIAQAGLSQTHSNESGIPCVDTVPPASGSVVADILSPRLYRIHNVGAENSGKYANLYYYNEKTGALEYVQAVKVNADGTVDFKFSHASEYVIVLSNTDMKPAASTTPNATPAVTAEKQVKTGDNTPIACMVVLLFVAGAAVVVLYRRRKRV